MKTTRNLKNIALLMSVIAAIAASSGAPCCAEITSFDGFPEINVLQPGNPTFSTPRTSDYVEGALRPKWTRAMTDIGGWPAMYKFQDDIYLEFQRVDGHRGKGNAPGANGDLVRYRSSDDGSTWDLLQTIPNQPVSDYVATGDALYRFNFKKPEYRSYASKSIDGLNFTTPQPVYQPNFVLYGAIYDDASNKLYAPAYYLPHPEASNFWRQVQLIESTNGVDWTYNGTVVGFGNQVGETAIHIQDDGSMAALVRQTWSPRNYFVATSPGAPFDQWTAVQANSNLEGHQFFEVDGQLFLGSRAFLDSFSVPSQLIADNHALGQTWLAYTLIYKVGDDMSLTPWAVLDSLGDNAYPRAVVTDDEVLIAYYSQHQDRVDKVYLAAFDKDTFLAGPLLHAPEPSTFALAAAGSMALALLWRKHRAQAARRATISTDRPAATTR
jgi:hypothetical protein